MFSDKKNILQLAALLKAHGVRKIVLCPGGRNTAIVQTLSNIEDFTCYAVTDERSAGFFAIGLSLQGGGPAAVCCTSGSALLNLYPAVAEAFYQQIALIVISADYPAAWIGQTDSQTLPQPHVFGSLVKMSINLPEINNEKDEWFCNRLINEAILETTHHGKGPVHINVPISEPIYRFTAKTLPEVRVITRYQGLNVYDRDYKELIARLNRYNKRMIVVGQMNLIYLYEKKYEKALYKHFVWLTEHLSNQTIPGIPVKNFDTAIYTMEASRQSSMAPDLLITFGGQIISKQLKKYLRNHPPKEHWHIATDGKIVDPYGCLTTLIEMDPFEFLEKVSFLIESKPTNYPLMWENYCKTIPVPELPYSQMAVTGKLIQSLPTPCALHLANGSTVKYAQMFPIASEVEICCNLGTGGIEGTLSTAIGYAAASDRLNFVITGDLSFFSGMNALWNGHFGTNLRILLLNNEGAETYHTLPGMDKSSQSRSFITAEHHTTAKGWAEECGFIYRHVSEEEELEGAIQEFISSDTKEHPILLEVFTDREKDTTLLRSYYRGLKEAQIGSSANRPEAEKK